MKNIVVVIIGHGADDAHTIEAYPAWECDNVEAHIIESITAWCNKHGTGGFKVMLRELA